MPAHRRDAEVLEHDTKEKREGVVDQELSPDALVADGGRGAVDEPFANEIAQDATGTAVGDADYDGGPHRAGG